MKSVYRFIFIAAFMVLPFLVQPAFAVYFEHDPENPAEHAPMKEGEKAVIPLDTKDLGYNIWQKTREDLTKGREPGQINIQRFPGGRDGWASPPFSSCPLPLRPRT
jgi:agmatinase